MADLREIHLFNADTLEYAGKILVHPDRWEYHEVADEYLKEVTSNMPLKGVLSCLISFNLVYEMVGVYT